jgi:rhodanese-related sulfurtransferase
MTNTITPTEVHEHLKCSNCLLIDVREADERASEAIPGSLHLPLGRIKAGELPPGGRQVIVHCKGGKRSAEAAELLPGSLTMAGGIDAWRSIGLPTVRHRASGMSVMRQVQLVIGAGVAAGTALGAFVSPWFLVVPAFMGAGLAFAGATGFCGLAVLMGKLPWNVSRRGSCGPSSDRPSGAVPARP